MQDFDAIYSQYFAEVYKFVLSLCRDAALAEEITQEAFFKALKNIDSFKGNSKISTWLCQIAKNTYYTYSAKAARLTGPPPEALADEHLVEMQIADKELAMQVYAALHRLREPYKEVFLLRTFGELSYAQIAVLFDKTESWARVAYYRAKMQIREGLE
ncbi:MAG: RNA polymerase sigma factor [Firmicutes bacterium]|nr:RNA polymerase sigma factor [Bacillota bacterium]